MMEASDLAVKSSADLHGQCIPKGALLPKRSRYSALLSQMQHAVSLGAERSRAIRLKAHDGSFRSCS
jgi:hypothetical protein